MTLGAFLLSALAWVGFIYGDMRYGSSVRKLVGVFDIGPELAFVRSLWNKVRRKRSTESRSEVPE